jgi:hypothetical protein
MVRTAPTPKLIPLKDAPWVFASQRLRSEWRQAQEAPSSSKTSKLNSASPELIKKLASENPAEAVKIVAESVGNIMEDMRFKFAPEGVMQESLLEKLRDGKLEAWGVESAPERKRELEMLPPHFFMDARISWNRNTVTSLGTTYSAVQVRRRSSAASQVTTEKALSAASNLPSGLLGKHASQETGEANGIPTRPRQRALTPPAGQETGEAQRQKPGPPSAVEEVIAAYELMLQKGDIEEGMTIKAIYQKLLPVLKRNSTMFPNGRGLAYSSIARHLRSHLTGSLRFSS